MEWKCESEYLRILPSVSLYLFNPPIIDSLRDKALLTRRQKRLYHYFMKLGSSENQSIDIKKYFLLDGSYIVVLYALTHRRLESVSLSFIDPQTFWAGNGANGRGRDSQIFHLFISCSSPLLPSAITSVSVLRKRKEKTHILFIVWAPVLQSTHTHTRTEAQHTSCQVKAGSAEAKVLNKIQSDWAPRSSNKVVPFSSWWHTFSNSEMCVDRLEVFLASS